MNATRTHTRRGSAPTPSAALVAIAGAMIIAPASTAISQESVLARDNVPFFWTRYDGVTDDLLTAGLGVEGIRSATPPAFEDPVNPTPAELRRLAIYTNTRALVDTSEGGGYGRLYGPGVPLEPGGEPVPELIPGDEFITYANPWNPRRRVTVMVQVPDGFDPDRPCIVTGPSSGSRGVYGAIGTSGEWGLKKRCAVAYSDKGTGTGAHDLAEDTVNLIRGERADADTARRRANFIAPITDEERLAFDAALPDRFAFKHAHSERNPERDWDRDVLESIGSAFVVLNTAVRIDRFPDAPLFTPDNTIVIASSVSNGGGASIRAAELDGSGLIDGVAVSEPNINPVFTDAFVIRQGEGDALERHSRPLYDYVTLVNVYQGCANLAEPDAPLNPIAVNPTFRELAVNRCASLRDKGLLESETLEEQAAEAQAIINEAGLLPEQNVVLPSHWFLQVPQAITVTYANAYGRFSVLDDLCGYSFGATDPATGAPVPLSPEAEAALFATSSGIPPTGGIDLVNDLAPGGPTSSRLSVSPSTGRADENLDGALCLRALATGRDPVSGEPLAGEELGDALRVQEGIQEVLGTGDLGGTPAVIVHGRADANLALNHTSRSYFGLNRVVEGEETNLRYYEILDAQHLDALLPVPGFAAAFIPLHHYLIEALNLMWDHLTEDAPLPPSQVVRAEPRGAAGEDGAVPPLTLANLPPIEQAPEPGERITFDGGEVFIPD